MTPADGGHALELVVAHGLAVDHHRAGVRVRVFGQGALAAGKELLRGGVAVAMGEHLLVVADALVGVGLHLFVGEPWVAAEIFGAFVRLAHPGRAPLWRAVEDEFVAAKLEMVLVLADAVAVVFEDAADAAAEVEGRVGDEVADELAFVGGLAAGADDRRVGGAFLDGEDAVLHVEGLGVGDVVGGQGELFADHLVDRVEGGLFEVAVGLGGIANAADDPAFRHRRVGGEADQFHHLAVDHAHVDAGVADDDGDVREGRVQEKFVGMAVFGEGVVVVAEADHEWHLARVVAVGEIFEDGDDLLKASCFLEVGGFEQHGGVGDVAVRVQEGGHQRAAREVDELGARVREIRRRFGAAADKGDAAVFFDQDFGHRLAVFHGDDRAVVVDLHRVGHLLS